MTNENVPNAVDKRQDAFIQSVGLIFVVVAAYFVPLGGLVAVWILSRGPLRNRRNAVRILLVLACVMLAVQMVFFLHFILGWPPSKMDFKMESGVVEP